MVRGLTNANLTDRIYISFLVLLTIALLTHPPRVENPWALVAVNLGCLVGICGLIRWAERSVVGQFLHDWYPLAMFIVCFEEVSRLSFLVRDRWQDPYILAMESRFFAVPPTVWLGRHGSGLVTEFLEIGYFSYFVLLMIVGGVLYARADRRPFRQVMDATVVSYLLCYVAFILFPTEGPAHTLASQQDFVLPGGGPFHWMVGLIQKNAGVHGNAFPSAHVAGGVVALFFAWKYAPRLGVALTPLVVLLCVGAVYDRYHYVSDVVAGVAVGLVPALAISRGWADGLGEERGDSPAGLVTK